MEISINLVRDDVLCKAPSHLPLPDGADEVSLVERAVIDQGL